MEPKYPALWGESQKGLKMGASQFEAFAAEIQLMCLQDRCTSLNISVCGCHIHVLLELDMHLGNLS